MRRVIAGTVLFASAAVLLAASAAQPVADIPAAVSASGRGTISFSSDADGVGTLVFDVQHDGHTAGSPSSSSTRA